jgi:hypothetical protein
MWCMCEVLLHKGVMRDIVTTIYHPHTHTIIPTHKHTTTPTQLAHMVCFHMLDDVLTNTVSMGLNGVKRPNEDHEYLNDSI